MKSNGLVLSFLMSMSVGAVADQEREHEALAKLAHEIEALQPVIDSAQAQADYPARIHFQYAWLKQDLAKVREGILEHVHAPLSEPRRIPPLSGDYRR
jgi:RAQPRD family integrative conjugative element protein